jgi:hypothetical protein
MFLSPSGQGKGVPPFLAFLTATSGRVGLTHLIVDRSDTAKKAFGNEGLGYTEAEVLQLELPNTPGALRGLPASLLKKTSTSPWATLQARRGPRRRYFGHGLGYPDSAVLSDLS